jgi:hypothetical protein
MRCLEDPAQKHTLTARKSNDNKAAWRHGLLLLPLRMAGPSSPEKIDKWWRRGAILQKVEAGQRPDWYDIGGRSLIYKSYWAQWNFLIRTDDLLERHWSQPTEGPRQSKDIVVLS